MTFYRKAIIEATGCDESIVGAIEDIMRNIIFHSTLDWQPAEVFDKGAREAFELYNSLDEESKRFYLQYS